MGGGLHRAEQSPIISAEILMRKELAPLPSVIRSKSLLLALLGSGLLRDCLAGGSPASGVSSLLGLGLLSGWVECRLPVLGRRSDLVVMVAQVTGVTDAAMAVQWHEVLQPQVTSQVGSSLDGGAVEVGEGSDLTQAVG